MCLKGILYRTGQQDGWGWQVGRVEYSRCPTGHLEIQSCDIAGLTAESDSTPIILAALGLVNDVSNEMPLGFYAALFVIFYLLCVGQRSILATATFGSYWLMFALLSVLIHVAAYILAFLLSDVHMVVSSLFLSALACCAVFPVIYLPFELLGGAIGGSEKH